MADLVETSELLAFAKIVNAKSVSRAASELGVPRATISRRLARLEAHLGTRLLRRTTRSLVLTDAGQTLYRHAGIVLEAVERAEASVRRTDDRVRGDLRLSVPQSSSVALQSFLCDFVAKYPDVRLHVHASNRRVDLLREGYDVALRAGSSLEPGLIARTLARTPLVAVASPDYLAAHGEPKTRGDLARHRCLMGFAAGEVPETHWLFANGGMFQVDGVFSSNDPALRAAAALRGLGIAVLPLPFVHPFLESGALVQILADVIRVDGQVALVYPERELMPPQVRAFIDAIVAWAPRGLDHDLPGECKEAARAFHRHIPRGPKARRRARA